MKRYLVYTTDEFAKRAIDPTRVFAFPQPKNPCSEAPVEKVGLGPLALRHPPLALDGLGSKPIFALQSGNKSGKSSAVNFN